MSEQIECPNCGAGIGKMEEKCPYCGSTNLTGARASYRKKLDGMVDDLEQMKDDSYEETGRELKRSGSRLLRILVVLAVILAGFGILRWRTEKKEADRLRQDYTWKKQYFAQMDQVYEEGDYEQLLALFEKAVAEKRPVYEYEHADLCHLLSDIQFVDTYLAGGDTGSMSESELALLMHAELSVAGASYRKGLREEELAYIRSAGKGALEDLDRTFGISADSLTGFGEYMKAHQGWPDYDACREYVKKMKQEGK